MKRLVIRAVFAAALIASGCGDDEPPPGIPAAGDNTPLSTTPAGIEPGAPYDLSAGKWSRQPKRERYAIAQAYIDDNESRCLDSRAADVAGYAEVSVGFDFPPDAPVSEILSEGCDAAVQS